MPTPSELSATTSNSSLSQKLAGFTAMPFYSTSLRSLLIVRRLGFGCVWFLLPTSWIFSAVPAPTGFGRGTHPSRAPMCVGVLGPRLLLAARSLPHRSVSLLTIKWVRARGFHFFPPAVFGFVHEISNPQRREMWGGGRYVPASSNKMELRLTLWFEVFSLPSPSHFILHTLRTVYEDLIYYALRTKAAIMFCYIHIHVGLSSGAHH